MTMARRKRVWSSVLTKLSAEEKKSQDISRDLVDRLKITDRALSQIAVEEMRPKAAKPEAPPKDSVERLKAFKIVVGEKKRRTKNKKTA